MGVAEKHKRSGTAAVLAAAVAAIAGPARAQPAPGAPVPYGVLAFDNRSGARGLEWMRLAVPFVLGEKLEAHPGLRPVYGTLVVPDGPPAGIGADAVRAFAARTQAEWVWTGAVDRAPDWQLVLVVQLWRARGDRVERIGEVQHRGSFEDVHVMVDGAIRELCARGGVPVPDGARGVFGAPTRDFYAFTLFGRGLAYIHGLDHKPHLGYAAKQLARAVFIDPKLAAAHRLLGVVHLWKKQWARARGQFAYALELRPGYPAALAGQARALMHEGRERRARELLEQLVDQRPWDVDLRLDLGRLYWQAGDVDRARHHLEAVVAAAPERLDARRLLVLVHAARGDAADLVSELEVVRELAPDDVEVQLDLAAAYAAAGRQEDAVATYRAVLDRHPRHLLALAFLGDLYRARGDLGAAIALYKRALRAHPDDPRPYFLLGGAYVAAGDDAAAKRVFLRAQRFADYLPETYNNLGSILYRAGRFGEARWYLVRAVRRRPESARLRYNLALVYSTLRDLDAAAAQIEAGLSLDPDHVGLHYLRGVLALRRGDADAARAAFERVLALDPDHEDARHNLALLDGMQRRAVDGEIGIELPQPAP